MADSHIQLEIENWIRTVWMPNQFGQEFTARRLTLNTGGHFDFDAVNADGSIVANISTSNAITVSGKQAAAKLQKLRSDMLFLCMVEAKTKWIVLSEADMYELCQKEKKNGRVPSEIGFLHAEIPVNLVIILTGAKRIASQEVTPHK